MSRPLFSWKQFAEEKRTEQEVTLQAPSGMTLSAPKGWWAAFPKDHWVLKDPDREMSLILQENSPGDFAGVAEKAWQRFRPGFTSEVKETSSLPGND
jgi:hypothetical protein